VSGGQNSVILQCTLGTTPRETNDHFHQARRRRKQTRPCARAGRIHHRVRLAAYRTVPHFGTRTALPAPAQCAGDRLRRALECRQVDLHQHLTQQKQLAFASRKPGRTQHINLFALGKQGVTDAILADLPGYGYAAVPKQDKIRWQQVMANYLVTRENLRAIVLLCDPRLGLTELDDILLDVIRPRVEQGLQFLIVLTKADKLTRSEGAAALSVAKLQAGGGDAMLFSAPKRIGIDAISQRLWQWAHPPQEASATQEPCRGPAAAPAAGQ
jgi:GTP-binding protein